MVNDIWNEAFVELDETRLNDCSGQKSKGSQLDLHEHGAAHHTHTQSVCVLLPVASSDISARESRNRY